MALLLRKQCGNYISYQIRLRHLFRFFLLIRPLRLSKHFHKDCRLQCAVSIYCSLDLLQLVSFVLESRSRSLPLVYSPSFQTLFPKTTGVSISPVVFPSAVATSSSGHWCTKELSQGIIKLKYYVIYCTFFLVLIDESLNEDIRIQHIPSF